MQCEFHFQIVRIFMKNIVLLIIFMQNDTRYELRGYYGQLRNHTICSQLYRS